MKSKLRSKKSDVVHEAVKASAYMEKHIDTERQRAVDFGVRMEQENAQLREELKSVITENDLLKNWTVRLRQRLYTLLRSIEVDTEVFSLPKMEIEDPDAVISGIPGCADDQAPPTISELRKKYGLEEEACGL